MTGDRQVTRASDGEGPPGVRRVTDADAALVIEVIALAFYEDPVWSWAFPDSNARLEQLRVWWGLHVRSAVPYGHVWMTDEGGAVSAWIPPGEPELNDEAEAAVEPLLREMIGSHADAVLELVDRFDSNHPHHTPHHYLSLLATHPDHRGQGKGMSLLAANLAEIDQLGMPAYLESSNPANHDRYERLGFSPVGGFFAPDQGPSVACMWRGSH